MKPADKYRENRLRLMAERRGMRLQKTRRRDPLAVDYGKYVLHHGSVSAEFTSLDEVERALEQPQASGKKGRK